MATLQDRLEASTASAEQSAAKLHDIVHGDAATVVTTDGGPVKSVAKSLKDLEAEYAGAGYVQSAQQAVTAAQAAAGDAATSEAQAAASAQAADNSAVAALGAAQSIAQSKVVAKSSSFSINTDQNGYVFNVDASAGPVDVTLPLGAVAGEPWENTVNKIDASANPVTLRSSGSDTILGDASYALSRQNSGVRVALDIDVEPDNWAASPFGVAVGDATPVGTVTWFAGRWPPNGWFVLDGAQLNRATHPDLWAHVQASGISVSEANWQADPMQRGRFSRGDEATTFRLPDLVSYESFIRATGPDSGLVGYRQSDAIRNIIGTFHAYNDLTTEVTGAFTGAKVDDLGPGSSGTDTIKYTFDASRSVPTADENRPKSTRYIPIIKAYNAVTNQAQVEMGQVVQDVAANTAAIADLKAGTAVLYEYGPDGQHAGPTVAGAWTPRGINLKAAVSRPFVSVSGHKFTLLPGKYRIRTKSPFIYCNGSRTRLYDETHAAVVDGSLSLSVQSGGTSYYFQPSYAEGVCEVVIAEATTCFVDYIASLAYGLGLGCHDALAAGEEYFGRIEIERLA